MFFKQKEWVLVYFAALASFSPSFSACSRSFGFGEPSTAIPGWFYPFRVEVAEDSVDAF